MVALRRDVHCIAPDVPLTQAWRLMKALGVRHLPVTRGRMLMGVVSDRELLLHGTLALDGTVRSPSGGWPT
jgi:CBS domain-containing protein